MRYFRLALITTSLTCGMAAANTTPGEAQNAVVAVIHLAADGSEVLRGNGFLIGSDGLLLTNYHLVVRASRLRITLAGGDIYDRVTLKALDPAADLAILKIPAFNAPHIELSRRPGPEPGEILQVVSRGLAPKQVRVAESYELKPGVRLAASNQTWDFASKGCPVLDAAGAAVGITTLSYQGAPGTGVIAATGVVPALLAHPIDWPLDDMDWRSWSVSEDPGLRGSLEKAGLHRHLPDRAIWEESDLVHRLELSLAFDPTDGQARSLLAHNYLQRRAYVEARAQIARLLSDQPDLPGALVLEADLFRQTGDFDKARLTYQSVLEGGGQVEVGYDRSARGVVLSGVIHDHAIAYCSGAVILSADALTFRPGFGPDGFSAAYSGIKKIVIKRLVSSGRTVCEFHLWFAPKVKDHDDITLRFEGQEVSDQLAAYLKGKGIAVTQEKK